MSDFFLMQNKITATPDGATVTPVDDYTIWLRCADVSDTFGSLASVIADTTAMETLCNNLNALRYMVRSEDVIMPAVLANSNWIAELKACAYAVSIPTMTNYTVPSGEASASSEFSSEHNAWRAFDKDIRHFSFGAVTGWLQYQFEMPVYVFQMGFANYQGNYGFKDITIQGSNNGSTFTNIKNITISSVGTASVNLSEFFTIVNSTAYDYWRLNVTSNYGQTDSAIIEVQFYGLDLS